MRGNEFAMIFDNKGLPDTESNRKAKKAASILWWATYMSKKQKGDQKPEVKPYLNRMQLNWQNGRVYFFSSSGWPWKSSLQ